MSGPSGITQSYLAKNIPDGARKDLSPALNDLLGKGVTRSSDSGDTPRATFGDAGIDGARRSIRGDLKDRIGQSSAKAGKVLDRIDDRAMASVVRQGNEDRLANLSKADAKELKSQLHYPVGKRVGNAEDRMINRAAILNAFAQGASLDETRSLRTFLDSAPRSERQAVLDELNQPGADARTITAKRTSLDPTNIGVRTDNRSDLQDYMRGPMDMMKYGDAMIKAEDYLEAHMIDLGITDLKSEISINTKAELMAVSCYTDNALYHDANDALRARGGREEPLKDEGMELFVNATRSGLAKLPDFEGVVVRGVDFKKPAELTAFLANYEPGQTVTEHAFTSTSADRPFGGNVQFVIESRHGKEIGDLSVNRDQDGGREILFPPGTRFEVLGKAHDEAKDVHYIVMKEVG